jgi:cytochrome c6
VVRQQKLAHQWGRLLSEPFSLSSILPRPEDIPEDCPEDIISLKEILPVQPLLTVFASLSVRLSVSLFIALTVLVVPVAASPAPTPSATTSASHDAAVANPVSPAATGAKLFEVHCAGCHLNGGNIVRRGKTLKLKALQKNQMDSLAAIVEIVTQGKGNMSAYRDRLTADEIDAVATYVLEQAEAGWRS